MSVCVFLFLVSSHFFSVLRECMFRFGYGWMDGGRLSRVVFDGVRVCFLSFELLIERHPTTYIHPARLRNTPQPAPNLKHVTRHINNSELCETGWMCKAGEKKLK